MATVKAISLKGARSAMRSTLYANTGWVQHRIRPIITTSLCGTRATDGLARADYRSRLKYVGGLSPGANVFMVNPDSETDVEFRPNHFWLAQLLPPPEGISTMVWKTRHPLPPDCKSGTYCCKVQWFHRTAADDRKFTTASCQYISLSCIVPVQFVITLKQVGSTTYELSSSIQDKILKTMRGLVVSD